MKDVAVVIPVYRIRPEKAEWISLRQTLRVLGKHDIVFTYPKGMDLLCYSSIAESEEVSCKSVCFDPSFFVGVEGYNRLLLSKIFYKSFENYSYILICQLDAYVFRDELSEWCAKGYDYIGAPLIGHYSDTSFSKKMRVGNGGLSLRRVRYFLDYFSSHRNVLSPRQIACRINLRKKPYTRVFVMLLMLLGWRNKPITAAYSWNYNEDDFWSGFLSGTRYQLRMPNPDEAMFFSFERFSKELYELTNQQLPFGCHAWMKYQYDEFWKSFIPLS